MVGFQSSGKNSGNRSGPMAMIGNPITSTTRLPKYSNSAKIRCQTSLRTPYWSWATVMASTNEDIADEPAHSEMRKPTDTISPLPVVRMSSTVGAMICWTTLSLKIVSENAMILSWAWRTTFSPNQSPMNPRLPSRPSSKGGNDSVCQNAASAASEKMLPFQALLRVRPTRSKGPLRLAGREGRGSPSSSVVPPFRVCIAAPSMVHRNLIGSPTPRRVLLSFPDATPGKLAQAPSLTSGSAADHRREGFRMSVCRGVGASVSETTKVRDGGATSAPEPAHDATARPLRAWQRRALTKYLTRKPKDFLAVATPGAGKTVFGLRVAA